MSFRALAEKSPTGETEPIVREYPQYSPARAPRPALPTALPRIGHDVISSVSREIPYGRNENNRTRYAAGRGRPALPTASPRIGHDVISSVSREIPHNRNENNRTRYAAGRGRPALPTASPRIGHDVISSVSREIPCDRNENNRTRYAAGRGRPALPTALPHLRLHKKPIRIAVRVGFTYVYPIFVFRPVVIRFCG